MDRTGLRSKAQQLTNVKLVGARRLGSIYFNPLSCSQSGRFLGRLLIAGRLSLRRYPASAVCFAAALSCFLLNN